MERVSTSEIVARTSLGESVDQRWVEWASDLLEAGHESKALGMLAGALPPFNQFEMRDLVLRVFVDLGLHLHETRASAVTALVDHLVRSIIASPRATLSALAEIADLYVSEGYPSALDSFYLLYHAAVDLRTDEVQWYWPDANRRNIDELISEQCRAWVAKRPA